MVYLVVAEYYRRTSAKINTYSSAWEIAGFDNPQLTC